LSDRWAIWIDIEGFKFLHAAHNTPALRILGRLLEDIYLIGNKVYPEAPNRIFAHQLGDGVVIVSDLHGENPLRPIALATSLLRSLLDFGGVGRAGIAYGDFADVLGCYPKVIRQNLRNGGLELGEGGMTITQVMGSALINAYSVAHDGPKGPCLRVDVELKEKLAEIDGLVQMDKTMKSISVDWISSNIDLVDKITNSIRSITYSKEHLSDRLNWYINKFPDLPSEWKETAVDMLK